MSLTGVLRCLFASYISLILFCVCFVFEASKSVLLMFVHLMEQLPLPVLTNWFGREVSSPVRGCQALAEWGCVAVLTLAKAHFKSAVLLNLCQLRQALGKTGVVFIGQGCGYPQDQ